MSKEIHIHIGSRKVKDSEFKPGDKVHLGFGVAGGAGVFGTLVKIENGNAFVKNDEGRIYKGPANRLTSGR